MPVLPNPRHERFAQELAKGKSQTEAYAGAGYKPSDQHASRLARNGKVSGRIEELQNRAAERAEITIVSITDRLTRIADKAEALKEAPGLSVARQASMDMAKLHGHLKDKGESGVSIKYDFSGLDDERLAQLETILTAVAVVSGGKSRNPAEGGEA